MHKSIRNMLLAIGTTAVLSAATPALAYSNGYFFGYYYDYPGGTIAGYRIYCGGALYESWGEETGIFYYSDNYPFCP